MLKGIGVSDGIAIGQLLKIEEGDLTYHAPEKCDPENEISRFYNAVEKFCENTEKQATALSRSAGEQEAEIMRGHIGIIRDPFMTFEVKKLIDSGSCAEEALNTVCGTFISLFASTGDELTMQRAVDIRDVRNSVLGILLGVMQMNIADAPAGTVLCVSELTPSMASQINKENIVGILTQNGSTTSHGAILARAMEIPAVMGISGLDGAVCSSDTVILDGSTGEVILSPDSAQLNSYTLRQERQLKDRRELNAFVGKTTISASGEKYQLLCNIGKPEDAEVAMNSDGEGVGLFRTEFLFMDRDTTPTEEEQFAAYKKTALILKGKPLIIRTLDVGGDKDIPSLGLKREDNPFMGFRAIRYCLSNSVLFRTQLRAILRASVYGDVSIMFPMITCVEEVRQGRQLIEEVKAELKKEGIPYNEGIRVGIMIETAAAGVIADMLAEEADFFSIGTNDLTGYTMAADRGNGDVSYLYSPLQPAVLRMIRRIIHAAKQKNIPAGMCGEAAADPMMIPLLISFGLTEFSVSAPGVLRVRRCISEWTKERADEVTERVMSMTTEKEIRDYLKTVT